MVADAGDVAVPLSRDCVNRFPSCNTRHLPFERYYAGLPFRWRVGVSGGPLAISDLGPEIIFEFSRQDVELTSINNPIFSLAIQSWTCVKTLGDFPTHLASILLPRFVGLRTEAATGGGNLSVSGSDRSVLTRV
jgi:hypothetical protein